MSQTYLKIIKIFGEKVIVCVQEELKLKMKSLINKLKFTSGGTNSLLLNYQPNISFTWPSK